MLKPLGRVLVFMGEFPLISAEMIDHNASFQDYIQPSVTPEYGKYLAITCTGCHSENLKGGPGHGPDALPIPDISSSGQVGKWSKDQFFTALRKGKTPEGKLLSDEMPWKQLTYSNQEVEAIYAYLHVLP